MVYSNDELVTLATNLTDQLALIYKLVESATTNLSKLRAGLDTLNRPLIDLPPPPNLPPALIDCQKRPSRNYRTACRSDYTPTFKPGRRVKTTDVTTGEIKVYRSMTEAGLELGCSQNSFYAKNGKTKNGLKIELDES